MAKDVEMSELWAKNSKLANDLSRIREQSAARVTESHDLKSVVDKCERPASRAKLSRPCENLFYMLSTVAFSVLLAEQKDYKNCCKTLTTEKQCIPG